MGSRGGRQRHQQTKEKDDVVVLVSTTYPPPEVNSIHLSIHLRASEGANCCYARETNEWRVILLIIHHMRNLLSAKHDYGRGGDEDEDGVPSTAI